MKKNKLKITIVVLILLAIALIAVIFCNKDLAILKTVKSKKELQKIYKGENSSETGEIFIDILTMPFSLFEGRRQYYRYGYDDYIISDSIQFKSSTTSGFDSINADTAETSTSSTSNSSKNYSTTNIQVENVDEADITKTDGDYIYSISDTNVIITDVRDSTNIKIASKIPMGAGIPEDLILSDNKLTVISTEVSNLYNTIVEIYDLQNKENPKLIKSYKLYEPYYTSRRIDNKLYVISSGTLREEDDEIITYYREDNKNIEISLNNIKYLKDIKTNNQTLISMVDLNNPTENIKVSSYLIDIEEAYISERNIYLLNTKYDNLVSDNINIGEIKSIFGLKGIFGTEDYYEKDYDEVENCTEIYKFNILDNGTIKYDTKNKVKGEIINQFSLDEYNENLRVAVYDSDGSRVVIFDKNLNEIGKTKSLAKGEKMYSSRFMGDKAYLVTYRTVDPLYVIDVSNPTNPTVQGELKIPGYSTYLHAYDETHLIGIETKEVVNRDSQGKVISTTARIIGMKMALFDVSDVNNPVQISSTVIGDSRTTSAILTNHKALLFSKEKELIAIPVNNYEEDFEIATSSIDNNNSLINLYTNYNRKYVAEGYFVYNINLTDGFKLKGVVTHEKASNQNKYYYNYNNSKLLRGLYIEDTLFTVSESKIKINNLADLQLITELNIK